MFSLTKKWGKGPRSVFQRLGLGSQRQAMMKGTVNLWILLVAGCAYSLISNLLSVVPLLNTELKRATASVPYLKRGGDRVHINGINTPKVPYPPANASQSMSACLLIKDDNDILGQWIAYHYHVLQLRNLVVAVDPSSRMSPASVLDRWRERMKVTTWSDADFIPAAFLEKSSYVDPQSIKGDAKTSQWHEGNEDAETVAADLLKIENHRFRQVTFVSACLRHFRDTGHDWVLHIDTDEYVVVNPQLRPWATRTRAETRRKKSHHKNVDLSHLPVPADLRAPSAVFRLLNSIRDDRKIRKTANYPCVSLPRLLFGSVEDTVVEAPGGVTLETHRWMHRSNFTDVTRNAQPKVLIDVASVSKKDEMFKEKPFSIHRPSRHLCRPKAKISFEPESSPLTVNHYIGSWDRYVQRNDTRRSRRRYDIKAHVDAAGRDDWAASWFAGFVETIGSLEQAVFLLAQNGG